MSSTARRMAVIGLDSGDVSLIERWSDMGMLPAFARLRREGTWIRLQNRGEFPSMTVWPSIYTGTHLGKNGVYFPVQLGRGNPRLQLVRPEQCGQSPFWSYLAPCGVRSIIVDVPFSYPIAGLKGLQISNWGSYERYAVPISEPPREIRGIQERFGRYPFGEELSRNAPIRGREFRRTRRKLLSGVPLKGEMIRYLMGGQAWDFFMAVFAETHPAGHYFWAGHDASSDPKTAGELGSTLLEVYKNADNELGKIIASLDQQTTLMVVSGHGIGPNHAGWHLLPDVLAKIGLSPTKAKGGGQGQSTGEKALLLRVRESIPRKWRDLVSHALPNQVRDYLRIHWANANIDWLNDRVFTLPTDAHGLIRVNLKGRDPEGKVKPGKEYEDICRTISRTLTGLVDPQTGKPVVKEVFLTDEIFPGPERASLPDLIVSWRNDKNIDAVASNKIETINGKLPDARSGNHRAEGFALLYGPGVAKGRESEGHLLDVAPTILNFYGQNIPKSFDGRPWSDIVS